MIRMTRNLLPKHLPLSGNMAGGKRQPNLTPRNAVERIVQQVPLFGISFVSAFLLFAQPSLAGDDVFTATTTEQSFEDTATAAENAIINRGYTIDYHGFIGDMLKRTAGDVGATKALYRDAEFFTFCSAVVSRDVMEGDIADIAYCPYVVFVYEGEDTPGTVTVGYRKLPEGGKRDQVNVLLSEIVKAAVEGF